MSGHQQWPRLLVAALMALTLAACNGDADPADQTTTSSTTSTTAPPTTTTRSADTTSTTTAAVALEASCTHDERGVTIVVRYPSDWHTDDEDDPVACSAFDPEPFELEEGTESPPDLGAVVRVEPVAFERAARPSANRVEGERRTEIDGREAVRLEIVSTGEELRPAGERSVRWVIDAGSDRSVVAHTSEVEGNDFEASTRVLDAMVEAFTIR